MAENGGLYSGETPVDQLLPECKIMVRSAFSAGKKIPRTLVERLATVEQSMKLLGSGNSPSAVAHGGPNGSRTFSDCAASLAMIHHRLCDIVAPAVPRTILLLYEEEQHKGRLHFLGPVPLTRHMMGLAFGCLAVLLLVSLSPDINGHPNSFDFLKNHGFPLFQNYLFLIAAAGLGASFASLFQANKYIKEGTFDPKFNASYWNRFLLGVMAGMIMAFFIPLETFDAEGKGDLQGMGKPLMAILGGFSSAAVHRILSRIVASLESLVKGDPKVVMDATEEKARFIASRRESQVRMGISAKLTGLRRMMGNKADPKQVKAALDKLQDELLSGESDSSYNAGFALRNDNLSGRTRSTDVSSTVATQQETAREQ